MANSSNSGAAIGRASVATASGAIREAQLLASLERSAITAPRVWLYIVTTLIHATDGFDLLMIGLIVPGVVVTFKLNAHQAGFFASSVFLGMTIGALFVSYLADVIGRKKAILLTVGCYGLLSLVAAFAWSYSSALVFRFLQGVGLGGEVPLVITYLLEFLPAKRRGLLTSCAFSAWEFSGLFAAIVAIFVVPTFGWRGMFVVGAILAFFFLILFAVFLPESVRSLIRRGRMTDAAAVVRRYSTVDPSTITDAETRVLSDGNIKFGDFFKGRYLRYTLGSWIMSLCWAMAFFGIYAWLPSILVRMGFSEIRSFAYTAAIAGAIGVGEILCGFFMQLVGRRVAMIVCFTLGGISMIAWGFMTSAVGVVALGMVTSFFNGGGVSGCLFTYIGEIYPTRFRATGAGLSTVWQRIGGIIAPTVLGFLLGAHGKPFISFLFLGIILLIGALAAITLMYETEGKPLEQIVAELSA